LIDYAAGESVGAHHQCTGTLLDDGSKSRRNLAFRRGIEDQQAYPENIGRGLHSSRLGSNKIGTGLMRQICNRVGCRHQFMQQFKALSC
jgi:hypothetical protein